MSDLFTCPQGHQWQAARDDASESGRQPAVCPVCSSLASTGAEGATPPTEDEMPPPPKPVAAMLADPAAGAPDAVRPVPGASQRHTPDGTRYAETGQGPQDAVAAEWPVVAGYQILDVLGRGGMGVVYRAKQVSLDRIVALKMVLSEGHLSPERVRRFRSEAEAAARLQHPNIVQIHEVGEQDGRPYFAQEFVDGGSLAQRLAGAPLPAHEAAQIVQTLAQAMHYAHQRGIVHRDLKPANILLQRKSEIPNPKSKTDARAALSDFGFRISHFDPKIADFGLAKRLDQEVGQTKTGLILGTPSYMAPEQARGQIHQISPLTDVYALGAILYELVAGRPPFRAATALDTVQQLLNDEVVAPTRLQPKVPRDLETICLKCLRKEASKRYASAAMLADDLRRFLEGRPITARRIGWWERTGKWARRRPAAAALLLVSGLAAVTLGIGGYRYQRDLERHNQELTTANLAISRERDGAEQQRDRADGNLRLARDAVDKTITKIASNRLLKQANFHQLRHELLQSMVPFFQEFVKQQANDRQLEAERGRAWGFLAYLRDELGEKERARSDYEQMRAIFAQLAADFPAMTDYRLGLAKSHSNLGVLLVDLGKRADAETAFREALKTQSQLAQDHPTVAEYRQDLATSHNNLGNLLDDLGKRADAETAYREALKIQAQLAQDFPAVPEYRLGLARTLNNLGLLLRDLGKRADAETAYREALKIRTQLAQDFPAVPEYRQELATGHNNQGNLLADLGKWAEAEAAYREALKIQAQLTQDFPAVPQYRLELARSHINLGNLLRDLGKGVDAEITYRNALKIQAELAQDFSAVPQYRQELAMSHNNLGVLLRDLGKRADAESAWRDALKIQAQLAQDFSAVPQYRQELAASHNNLGTLLADLGKRAEAEAAYRDALKIRAQLAQDFPTVPAYRQKLAGSHNNLARLLRDLGKRVDAESAYRDALKIQAQLAQDFPSVPDYRNQLAGIMVNLANLLHQSKELDPARRLLEEAVPHHQAALQANPDNPEYRRLFRDNRESLAETLVDLGSMPRPRKPLAS